MARAESDRRTHQMLAEMLENNLKASAEYAASYLRKALTDGEPQALVMALQQVTRARGGIDDLGLKLEETTALLNALGRHFRPEPLAQAA